jgi:predicted O-methyltransferase YrrM
MDLSQVKDVVKDLPYMKLERAKLLEKIIQERGHKRLLELGFYHGVSSCYFAAALPDHPDARLVTIDREVARDKTPNVEHLLSELGLRHKVDVYYEPYSYTWRMMRMLEDGQAGTFDFCYLDGGHTWDISGFAFCLVDRLLAPGGTLVLDDLNWSIAGSSALKDRSSTAEIPLDVREAPQVRKVFELLVMTHPEYEDFFEQGGCGFARKRKGSIQDLLWRFTTRRKTKAARKRMPVAPQSVPAGR